MPFDFDRYRYGKSNIILIESLKVSKYLSLGYLASIAMNREVSSDDAFQENRFLVTIGPEYAKVTIGYDAFRRNTMFLFSMLVGTKDTDIEFKRSVIKNPNKFGKDKENDVGSLIKALNYKKVLIHYGGGSVIRSGLLDRVKKSLDKEGILLIYAYTGDETPSTRSKTIKTVKVGFGTIECI